MKEIINKLVSNQQKIVEKISADLLTKNDYIDILLKISNLSSLIGSYNNIIQQPGIEIDMNNLVFYASLSSNTNTAETGQLIGSIGSPSYATVDNIACMQLDGNSALYVSDQSIPISGDLSICFGIRFNNVLNDGVAFHLCRASAHDLCCLNNGSTTWCFGTSGGSGRGGKIINAQTTVNVNTWYHITIIKSNGQLKCYQNGVQIGSDTWDIQLIKNGNLRIGCGIWDNNLTWYFSGYLTDFRIYDKALTETEISSLALNFN